MISDLDRTLPNAWYRLLIDWIAGRTTWHSFLSRAREIYPAVLDHMLYDEMGHAERIFEVAMDLQRKIGDRTDTVHDSPAGEFRTRVKIWWGEMEIEWSAAADAALPEDYWSRPQAP